MKTDLFTDFNFDDNRLTYHPRIWNSKNEILDFLENRIDESDEPEFIILTLEKIRLDILSSIYVLKSARFLCIHDQNISMKKDHEPKICDNELLLSQVDEILKTEKEVLMKGKSNVLQNK